MIETRLYKRNNAGTPIFWSIREGVDRNVIIRYGIVEKSCKTEGYRTLRKLKDEIKSRINQKRKEGYKEISEIYDNAPKELFGRDLVVYLNTYLPKFNTDAEGMLQPMKAKTYEYNKYSNMIGQFKINGLRCLLSYKSVGEGFFKQDSLRFSSREGGEFKCPALEQYLMVTIPQSLYKLMRDEDYVLDGELYVPGYTINEINSAAKNVSNPLNKLLQFWVYDLAIDNMSQANRSELLNKYLLGARLPIRSAANELKDLHLVNTRRLVLLPNFTIVDDTNAVWHRDIFIAAKFEGLILRDPSAEYQFGKRNQSMIKFKRFVDGWFTVIDIVPEGTKRPDLAKFICRNDINDATFEVMPIGTFDKKREYLANKDSYIGKLAKVEYGERSGVNNLPFHATLILVKNDL